jgi:hypothetical protein
MSHCLNVEESDLFFRRAPKSFYLVIRIFFRIWSWNIKKSFQNLKVRFNGIVLGEELDKNHVNRKWYAPIAAYRLNKCIYFSSFCHLFKIGHNMRWLRYLSLITLSKLTLKAKSINIVGLYKNWTSIRSIKYLSKCQKPGFTGLTNPLFDNIENTKLYESSFYCKKITWNKLTQFCKAQNLKTHVFPFVKH